MAQLSVTIETPELAKAINHLADAISLASKPQDYAESLADAATHAEKAFPASSADGVFTGTLATPASTSAPAISTEAAAAAPMPAPVEQATLPAQMDKVYTLDELSTASADLIDKGKMQQIMSIIQKYGVKAINQLRPDQFAAYAADIRGIGAKI
ncbi:MAG: hypothetical protein LIP12_00020 [Clostridiales bacterium]|nr:hypothetical protein [Clostridiales bacterium]